MKASKFLIASLTCLALVACSDAKHSEGSSKNSSIAGTWALERYELQGDCDQNILAVETDCNPQVITVRVANKSGNFKVRFAGDKTAEMAVHLDLQTSKKSTISYPSSSLLLSEKKKADDELAKKDGLSSGEDYDCLIKNIQFSETSERTLTITYTWKDNAFCVSTVGLSEKYHFEDLLKSSINYDLVLDPSGKRLKAVKRLGKQGTTYEFRRLSYSDRKLAPTLYL